MDYDDDEEERAIILNHKFTPIQRSPSTLVRQQYEQQKPGLLDGENSPDEDLKVENSQKTAVTEADPY